MSSKGQWRALQRAIHRTETSGKLYLAKMDFDESGYQAYVTDLCQVWAEKLDYTEVVRLAKDFDCPIDPSESLQQRLLLFKMMQDVFSEAPDTEMDFWHVEKKNTIYLELEAPTPARRAWMHWASSLHIQPAETIRDHLLGPLLETVNQRDQEVEQLKSAIKDKDRVLGRLLDRLESSAMDLSTIFPGTVGVKFSRKESQRAQLGRYVKGLAPLDQSAWQASAEPLKRADDLRNVLVGMVQNTETFSLEMGPDDGESSGEDGHATLASHDGESGSDTESDEDEFQVQNTPSKHSDRGQALQSSPTKSTPTPKASTRHAPLPSMSTSPSVEPELSNTPTRQKKRLGAVGGNKAKQSSPLPASEATSATIDAKAETANGTGQKPKKTKLGMIGGRRDDAAPPEATADDPEPSQGSTKGQHRGTRQSEQATTRTATTPDPDQSAAEADKRRDELKRQLATAPTAAKKKRKF